MPAARDAWTYVCGYVAVAETRLIDDATLAELADRGDLDRLRQELHQVPGYEALPAAVEEEGWRTGLEALFVERVRALARDCPDPAAAEVFLLNYDYQHLREHVRGRVARGGAAPVRFARWETADLERAWERTWDSIPEAARAVEAVTDALARLERPGGEEAGRVVDLVLDRVVLEAFRGRAAGLDSPFLAAWAADYVLFRSALAALRARCAGMDEAAVARHLLAGALADEWLAGLLEETAREGGGKEGGDGACERLAERLAERVGAASGAATTVERLAVEIDDALTLAMREARSTAFGPERVAGYAWGLYVENVNLRVIAQAAELGLRGGEVRARMRRGYG